MKAKLKTAIVYLGLCSTLFSCVPNEADFYEKDFPDDLESLDTRSRHQQEQKDGNSINEEIVLSATEPTTESSPTSTVVVYTDVEGTPIEITEDDLINIDDNTSNESTDIIVEDGPGDDQIPEELSGNSNSSNNSDSGSTDGSSANNDGNNSDSEVTDASNDNTNQATEGETSSNDSSSDAEGNVSTEEGTSNETGNDSVSENTSGNENGGTSNEGSSNESSDDSAGDETASNESGGTEGEGGSSGDDEQNINDQTSDNGDQSSGPEGSSSTEGDSNSDAEETADNGNGDDSTTGESDTQDNTDNSSEVTDNGGGGDESSGSNSENGDNTTDEEVTDNQEQSEDDETTGSEEITGNGSGSTGNSETSENNDGEGNESEEEDQSVIVVTEEDEEFVNEVETAVENDEYICDPFEGDEHSTSFQGIAGFVYDGLSHPYNDVHDYYLFGQKSNTPIFMPEINTPTRKFDKGFELNNGSFVENAFGGKLFEYFALDLRGQIKLGDLEEEGHYQFALISDDGSIFEIDKDGELKEHINNNQLTPTRMKCASNSIHFTHETKKKFRLKYFQGPRMHIALMLMWRKVDPENIPHEKYCNKGGNGLFFDFNQTPSEPKAKYKELLARGWKPLDSQNFLLPEGLRENPCGNEQPQAETQCLSEEVVLDGRNWFHFDGDDVDLSSLKITDEKDHQRSHHYVGPQKRIRIGGRCLRGHKFKVSYCTK